MLDKQTITRFRNRLMRDGISIADWARDNRTNYYAVSRLLNGYDQGKRGRSLLVAHAIQRFAGNPPTLPPSTSTGEDL